MNRRDLSIEERLSLITETVVYCHRVAQMGMPKSIYSKALREPIYFLWEKNGSKFQSARYASPEALVAPKGEGLVVYDHSVPFRYQVDELMALERVTPNAVMNVLLRYGVAALITKEQDSRLASMGLGRSMPAEWDGINPLSRYKSAGIEIIGNPCWIARSNLIAESILHN